MTTKVKLMFIHFFITFLNVLVTTFVGYNIFTNVAVHGGPVKSYLIVVTFTFIYYIIMHIFGDRVINEYKRSTNYRG